MQNTKKHAQHGFTQFELSKFVLNNLSQFNLKPITKLVLLFLCDCYNPKSAEVFPKQRTIADKLGVSEVSVIRAIQELHKEGLVVSERKYTNRYKFTSKMTGELGIGSDFKMIDEKLQNDRKEAIKMIEHEQKTMTKKEQTPEDEILEAYARKKGVMYIKAYINKLKETGSAAKIIKEYNKKRFIEKRAAENIAETQRLIEYNRTFQGVEPPASWRELGKKIQAMRY